MTRVYAIREIEPLRLETWNIQDQGAGLFYEWNRVRTAFS